MKYLNLIEDLTNAKGAPGFEDEVIEVLRQYKGDYRLEVDHLKNAYLYFNAYDKERPTVMLDSHLDEVGFIVQAIDAHGLLHLQPLGGWIPAHVAAQQFLVRSIQGHYYPGICTTKPIHFMTEAERQKPITLADLTIDLGAKSREEVIEQFQIRVGQPVVPATRFHINPHNQVMFGKAFDNRIGVAVATAVMHELANHTDQLPFNLVAAYAAQEEVGERGAMVTVKRIQPSVAVVLEGTPSDDFTSGNYLEQGKLGHGPQLRYRDVSYIANEGMLKLFQRTAQSHQIPLQHAVRAGGGTNAGAIHVANLGVPVATVGTPTRYAHTNHCFCSYQDFQQTVDLLVHFILDLSLADLSQFELQTY